MGDTAQRLGFAMGMKHAPRLFSAPQHGCELGADVRLDHECIEKDVDGGTGIVVLYVFY